MTSLDFTIVIAYLIFSLVLALIISRKTNLDSFLVAGRNFEAIFLIFTMVSTMVGLTLLLTTASATYSTGISFFVMSLVITLIGYFLAWFFSRQIRAFGAQHGAHTIGDFLAVAYSTRTRLAGAVVLIVSYFVFFAALLLGLSQVIQVFLGGKLLLSLALSLGGLLIYTAVGGAKSDFYTDIIHFVVMFISLLLVMFPVMFLKSESMAELFSNLPPGFFSLYSFGGAAFFWCGIIFGAPLFLLYMEVWQRIYASNSDAVLNKTFGWSALLTVPFLVLAALIGLYARKIFPAVNPDEVFLRVIGSTLPSGLRGFAVAGIIAAILSTLNSVLMVISACCTKDIYIAVLNRSGSEKQYLQVGRIVTVVTGLIAIGISYAIPSLVTLSVAASEGLVVLAPAVVDALVWRRGSEKGAFYSIVFGFLVVWGAYPLLGKMSFIPAFLVSLIIFLSLAKRRARAA